MDSGSANLPYALAATSAAPHAEPPSALAYRTHRANTRDKPPAQSENSHTGSPRSTSHTLVFSAAKAESAPPPSFSAATKPAQHSRETSPQTAPLTQAAATPARQPPPAPAKSHPLAAPRPSPETAAQSH